jgi:hypothetical protein
MEEGIYNSEDPDEIQNLPDYKIGIERNWHNIEYENYQLKVEIVKYLDGSIRCNAIKFLSSLDEISFVESIDDVIIYDDPIQEKFNKLIKFVESQLC